MKRHLTNKGDAKNRNAMTAENTASKPVHELILEHHDANGQSHIEGRSWLNSHWSHVHGKQDYPLANVNVTQKGGMVKTSSYTYPTCGRQECIQDEKQVDTHLPKLEHWVGGWLGGMFKRHLWSETVTVTWWPCAKGRDIRTL